MKRVAIIAGQLVVGGAERPLYLWLSAIDRRRFEPLVITLKAAPGDFWEEPIAGLGIPLVRETHSGNPVRRLLSLRKTLAAWSPDLIHGWHLFAGAYAGAVAKTLGVPGISSLRTSARNFERERVQSRLTEWLADAMLVNSQTAAAELRRAGRCRRQQMFVVRNGVEQPALSREEARAMLRQRLTLDEDVVWLGTMARMVPEKGFEPVLDLVASLRRQGLRAGALLVGDGPIRGALERQTDRLGLREAVRFTGEVPDARSWLSALDIYCCLSTIGEGLPNALLESSAAGVPVAGWRLPFAEEVLAPAADDALVAVDDRSALEQQVRMLIQDGHARRDLGARARAHVAGTFGVDRFAAGMTAMYDELLAS